MLILSGMPLVRLKNTESWRCFGGWWGPGCQFRNVREMRSGNPAFGSATLYLEFQSTESSPPCVLESGQLSRVAARRVGTLVCQRGSPAYYLVGGTSRRAEIIVTQGTRKLNSAYPWSCWMSRACDLGERVSCVSCDGIGRAACLKLPSPTGVSSIGPGAQERGPGLLPRYGMTAPGKRYLVCLTEARGAVGGLSLELGAQRRSLNIADLGLGRNGGVSRLAPRYGLVGLGKRTCGHGAQRRGPRPLSAGPGGGNGVVRVLLTWPEPQRRCHRAFVA